MNLLILWSVLLFYVYVDDINMAPSEYVIPIPGIGSDVIMDLSITATKDNTSVTIIYTQGNSSMINQTLSVEYLTTTVRSYTIPQSAITQGSAVGNGSLHVSATKGIDFLFVTATSSDNEGFRPLASNDIGTEYLISTFCDAGGICQVAVATTKPGLTEVYVSLPAETTEVVLCVGPLKWLSHTHTSLTLTYPEVLQIETPQDLTGTHIFTDKPVSVVSGTRSFPGAGDRSVHFMEQLVPLNGWSQEFLVPASDDSHTNIVHITAAHQRTTIEMSGFLSVLIPRKGMTIRRMLFKGEVSHIKADKSVQVVLYVGFTDSNIYTSIFDSVAMSIVPALDQFQSTAVLKCPQAGTHNVSVQYIAPKSASISLSSLDIVTTESLKFTDFDVWRSTQVNPQIISELSNLNFGGIIRCNNTMTSMSPLLIQASELCASYLAYMFPGDGVDNNCNGRIDEDLCTENTVVPMSDKEVTNGTLGASLVNVNGFRLLLLRVRTCSEVNVKLRDENVTDEAINLQLNSGHMTLVHCDSGGCKPMDSGKPGNIGSFNCSRDVMFYWVLRSGSALCMNVGHWPGADCVGATVKMNPVTINFTQMIVTHTLTEAQVWYDLYRYDCGKFVSDWRCQDSVSNCKHYQEDLCTNTQYTDWVAQNCPRFCGVYSSGRMFVAVSDDVGKQFELSLVEIDNTFDPYVGMITRHQRLMDRWSRKETSTPGMFVSQYGSTGQNTFIFASDDVVVYQRVSSYSVSPLLPVDALGSEYVTLSFGTANDDLYCSIVSSLPHIRISIYTKSNPPLSSHGVVLRHVFNESQTGSLIKSNTGAPVVVICGTDSSASIGETAYQLPPVRSWGVEHRTPAFRYPGLSAKLKVVTNNDNTLVRVSGDFNGAYVLDERGDYIEFDIDSGVSYTVNSSFPILVALLHYNESGLHEGHISFVPPVTSFAGTPLVYMPNSSPTVHYVNPEGVTSNITDPGNTSKHVYDYTVTSSLKEYGLASSTDYSAIFDLTSTTRQFVDSFQAGLCVLGAGTAGDGVDGDCDGLPDEEPTCTSTYGALNNDTDLDGAYGEDCATIVTGYSTLMPPPDPECSIAPVNRTTGCWKECACSCEWAGSLAEYQALGEQGQEEHNRQAVQYYIEALKMDVNELSSTTAEHVSAEDDRTSSSSIGTVAVIFIALPFVLIGAIDAIRLYRYFRPGVEEGNRN
ncbi:hypothetical protein MAR_024748 [Mya arenaria]|uniref:IgGFc-binding protein N-terminal domain-containing protein n=1 Tax=Mya arenaria TaxID=6604 RepID=A0ABY7DVN6_MYAAR|nr:hypothetical protein MAR_024748 [Mya arenaria]